MTFMATYIIIFGVYISPWVITGRVSESGGAFFVLAWAAYMIVSSSPDKTISSAVAMAKKYLRHFMLWNTVGVLLCLFMVWSAKDSQAPIFDFILYFLFQFSGWFPSIKWYEKKKGLLTKEVSAANK